MSRREPGGILQPPTSGSADLQIRRPFLGFAGICLLALHSLEQCQQFEPAPNALGHERVAVAHIEKFPVAVFGGPEDLHPPRIRIDQRVFTQWREFAVHGGWVGDTPGFGGDISKALGSIKAKTLFLYSPQDRFFQPQHIDAQVKMIPNARALAIDSPAGHMICCNFDPQGTRVMGDAIRAFLQELGAQRMTAK